MRLKVNLRKSTEQLYRDVYERYVRNTLGLRAVGSIKPSQAKSLYIDLQLEKQLNYGTVKKVQIVLNQVFNMLVADDVIRKNPTTGVVKTVRINPEGVRHALTQEEQDRFLDFMSTYRLGSHWRPLTTFLFGTGVCIGEAVVLKWQDVDFEEKEIHISRSLMGITDEKGNMSYVEGPPKSQSGNRTIPMFRDVEAMLQAEYKRQYLLAGCVDIGAQYVFHAKDGGPIHMDTITSTYKHLCIACNKDETSRAESEGRAPLLIPVFTPHVIRHTFCTRLCEQDVNVKVVQDIMGHSTAQITMDIYNEATKSVKKNSFEELEGKIRVSAG